ncbi:hypothetical protein [Spirosoma endophyticum]|nr:hypothetical protein [Spirosoma endophyticum]
MEFFCSCANVLETNTSEFTQVSDSEHRTLRWLLQSMHPAPERTRCFS